MALLGKAELDALPALKTEDVDVPELGGTLRVREWSADDGDDWSICVEEHREKGMNVVRAAAIAVSLVDEHGERICSMNGDVEKIKKWPHAAVRRVYDVIHRMNRIGEKAEDAEKN